MNTPPTAEDLMKLADKMGRPLDGWINAPQGADKPAPTEAMLDAVLSSISPSIGSEMFFNTPYGWVMIKDAEPYTEKGCVDAEAAIEHVCKLLG